MKTITLRIGRPVEGSADLDVQSVKAAFSRMDVLRFLFGKKSCASMFILDDYRNRIHIREETANEPNENVV
ncbi:hypothetical protein FACS18948_6790 [Clostridia bacterium]|nr:hypothetical protein FACS18948_6790 [Clostridia bacterium]